MIGEFFRALFQAGVPIAATSFLLVWWALKHDYLGPVEDLGEVERRFKRLSKDRAAEKKAKKGAGGKRSRVNDPLLSGSQTRKLNPAHNKWLAFGGGFYGVVGLLTYAVVELGEIRDFIAGYNGLWGMISQFSPGMLIELFIDAIKNFIVAIAWPLYWLGDIAGEYIWIWFGVAYGAYWAGCKTALRHFNRAANK